MTRFHIALSAALTIAALTASAKPAAAIEYPWCVDYAGGDNDGGRNCGFVSYEQCMMTARGAGGSCERNLFYEGAENRQQKRPRKRKVNN